MAYNLATAYVPIVPSMDGVGKAIEKAFGDASKTTGSKTGQSIGKGLSVGFASKVGAVAGITSNVFSKVASVVTSSLGSAVDRADQMNNFPKVMKNLGYSATDAAASIKKISDALDGLPTTSSAMTGMVQQLAPLTSNLDEATDIALAFNNAMLAGGASTMEQENALTQYTQMLSAGKVDMQAWRSIQAAMPGQLNQVAEAMLGAGKNSNDLYEAMKNGSISFDDFNKKVMELNQNGFGKYASFAQQAKDATQGIGTAMENVQNRVAKAVQKVIEAVGVENIAGAINGFSSQFGKIGDAAAGMVTGVKGWFGKAAQAAQPLVSIWQSDFGQLGVYLKGLGVERAGVRRESARCRHEWRGLAELPHGIEQHHLPSRQLVDRAYPQREHLHRHAFRQRRSAGVPRVAQRTLEGAHAARSGIGRRSNRFPCGRSERWRRSLHRPACGRRLQRRRPICRKTRVHIAVAR